MKATGNIDTLAAQWVSRREAGLDPREERELADWLACDPRHAEAFSRLAAAAAVFDRARDRGAADLVVARLRARAGRRRRRSAVATAAGTLAVAAAAVFVFLHPRTLAPSGATRPPAAGSDGLQVRTLPDGSVVELKAGSDIALAFEPAVRRLRLLRGEAHFQVAKNAARPFLVQAGSVEVRAVGTAFDVDLRPQSVGVIVTEGKVSLDRTESSPPGGRAFSPLATTFVRAGSGVVVGTAFRPDEPLPVTPMTETEKEARLRWRAVTLKFAGTGLLRAAAEMNRYNRLQISIRGDSVGQLRVSGVFNSDNPEGFVRIVQASFDLKAERRGDSEIVLGVAP